MKKGSISYKGQELKQIKLHHFFKHELGYLPFKTLAYPKRDYRYKFRFGIDWAKN